MTPMLNGNVMPQPTGSPALLNSVSSLGQPESSPEQKPNPVADQASQLINRFGSIMQTLNDLSSSFPTANKEYSEVVNALKNWLAKASDAITSGGGGEPTTY